MRLLNLHELEFGIRISVFHGKKILNSAKVELWDTASRPYLEKGQLENVKKHQAIAKYDAENKAKTRPAKILKAKLSGISGCFQVEIFSFRIPVR